MTYRELRQLPKKQIAQMHIDNGGLMLLSEYMKWTKDELIAEVLEDQRVIKSAPDNDDTARLIVLRWNES